MPGRKRRAKVEPVTQHEDSKHQMVELFQDTVAVQEMDLVVDLDEEFFSTSHQLIQQVAQFIDVFVAGKLKRYVDLLERIHKQYVIEVKSNESMQYKVRNADEKLRLALDTTASSEIMFNHLRVSLEEAWRTADAVQHREAIMQTQLAMFMPKDEDIKADTTVEMQDTRTKDLKVVHAVFRERDRCAAEVKDLLKRLEMNRFYGETLEAIIESNKDTMLKQQGRIKILDAEMFRLEHRSRVLTEAYEDQVKTLQKELVTAKTTIKEMHQVEGEFHMCQQHNEALKQTNERLSRENYSVNRTFLRLEEDKMHLKLNITLLEDMKKAQGREFDELECKYRTVGQNLKKKSDAHALLKRKFNALSRKNGDLNERMYTLENTGFTLEKKLNVTQAKLDDKTKSAEEFMRQRDKLRLEIGRLNDLIASKKYDMVVQRNEIQARFVDLEKANIKLDEKDHIIHTIKREKAELEADTNDLHDRIENLEETLSAKVERIVVIDEQLQTKQHDYMAAKKQMEIIHSEKVMLEKSLGVCTRDRQSLHNINGKLTHQINQMSNEIASSEKEITGLKCRIEQLNSAIKQKLSEYQSLERTLQWTRTDLREMKIRYEQAQHTIDEDAIRFKKFSNTLEEVRKEKNLVGLQMMRRNDELGLLKERLAMMQKALDNGTSQYNQRINDIRLLKMEITNLSMSRDCMRRAIEATANMRQEVVRLERQLNRERLRVSAFSEELARPCRIHRWRVLLGRDPKKYDLMRKIQALLKRNMRLNVERVNMGEQMQDVQKRYDTLKQQLKHMPDPSIRERLCIQQRINRNQNRKLKAIKAELAINEIDLQARECIIEGYQRTLKKCKGAIDYDTWTDQAIKESSSEHQIESCKRRPKIVDFVEL